MGEPWDTWVLVTQAGWRWRPSARGWRCSSSLTAVLWKLRHQGFHGIVLLDTQRRLQQHPTETSRDKGGCAGFSWRWILSVVAKQLRTAAEPVWLLCHPQDMREDLVVEQDWVLQSGFMWYADDAFTQQTLCVILLICFLINALQLISETDL